MAKIDPAIAAHIEWLGFVQPTGLVVSAPTLVRAGAILNRSDAETHQRLQGCIDERVFQADEGAVPYLPDFCTFARATLGWSFSPNGYAGTDDNPIPGELEFALPDYHETLRPDFAVRERDPHEGASAWQLLVRVVPPGKDFDRSERGPGGLEASAHGRMERLLRQTGTPAGLLFNGRALRLVSAPRGESSGWLDFRVADMAQTAGRPIATALRMLLGEPRLLALPREQRLAALLDDSRRFQNEVSERLAEQVLHALYELLRGFQAAHDASKGDLLREPLIDDPDAVYRALLTVLLRLVFLLYAEERGMLSEDETFLRYYSLAGLYERLREDDALYPDTMDQRFGAWAQLLVLFRVVFDGADAPGMRLPRRHGVLFDPDRFKFLEGRAGSGARQTHERVEAPLVPDGTIFRALEKLLVLDGERISYRALDVEQIGSVYETMMGFRLETATGRSVAIKPPKAHGAPTVLDLEALLAENPVTREKWFRDRTDRKLTDRVKQAVTDAATLDDLHAALDPVIDVAASPDLVAAGAMVLQPSEERRRSGSHYTPRTLTEPIVRTALEPILARLRDEDGGSPRPELILDLKVCDLAMGSGAFLVETCRQLADVLVEAWHAHGVVPQIPADEDEVVYARRLIAQRCLYGVDRNPVAVDLAKVSLWLVTLAREHALTFVDHALRHGDSLVGLSRPQIEAFHWKGDAPEFAAGLETMQIREHVAKAAEVRTRIREADESTSGIDLHDLWDEAQFEVNQVRLFADLVIAAYFDSEKEKDRETTRRKFADAVVNREVERYRAWLEERRHDDPPLSPFHWEIEFPEVFGRENAGFDAIVGNPPFFAGSWITAILGKKYRQYIVDQVANGKTGLRGTADLCVYFVLRCSRLVRRVGGTVGLVLSSTVGEGDSKEVGTEQLIAGGATIFAVRPRFKWPGLASVDVVMLWYTTSHYEGNRFIGTSEVPAIYADLSSREVLSEPQKLAVNAPLICKGHELQGNGFKLTADVAALILEERPDESAIIRPLVTGDDLNETPVLSPSCYVINFSEMDLSEARKHASAFAIVESEVRPERALYTGETGRDKYLRTYWWKFRGYRRELAEFSRSHERILACTVHTKYVSFAFIPSDWIPTPSIYCFLMDRFSDFALLQSTVHMTWAIAQGSMLGATPRYIAGRCFNTFPLLAAHEPRNELESAGRTYYEYRADLMSRSQEGLTEIYNRFHDPDERGTEIVKLRELHTSMDRAVLQAYGWSDVSTGCEFVLEYEIDEAEWGSKKKPWRFQWPEDVRDDILARLLELNAQRAAEETRAGARAAASDGANKTSRRTTKQSATGELFS